MSPRSLYADFGAPEAPAEAPAPAPAPHDPRDAAQQSRSAYDKGYASGWDDATAAATRRSEAITSELERAIEDMGFTYHEAVGQVRAEFTRFVRELMDAFLPSLAAEGLRDHLRARIEEMASPAAESRVEILVHPGLVDRFSQIERDDGVFPIKVLEEPSLSEAQAFAKIGDVEWSIDFTQLLNDLDTAMSADTNNPEGNLANVR